MCTKELIDDFILFFSFLQNTVDGVLLLDVVERK